MTTKNEATPRPLSQRRDMFWDIEAEEHLIAGMLANRKIGGDPDIAPGIFSQERKALVKNIKGLVAIDDDITRKTLQVAGCPEDSLLSFDFIRKIEDPPGSGSCRTLIDRLRTLAIRRYASEQIKALHGDAGELEAGDLVGRLNELASASQRLLDVSTGEEMKDGSDVEDMITRLKRKIEDPNAIDGFPTGSPHYDQMLSGWQGGRFYVLAARPHIGKTTHALGLLSDMMDANPDRKEPALFFSLEMTKPQIQDAMLSIRSMISLQPGQRPTKNELIKIRDAIKGMQKLNWRIDDSDRLEIDAICAKARLAHRKHGGLLAIFVDYIQIVNGSATDGSDMRLTTNEITGKLKALSKELDVPVIGISQINRSQPRHDPSSGKEFYPRPRLDLLKESSSLESDSDVVIMVHRDLNDDETDDAEIIFGKNRCTGWLGVIPCQFQNRRFWINHGFTM